jgi:hypothetical protein
MKEEELAQLKNKLGLNNQRQLQDFYAHIPLLQLSEECFSLLGGNLRYLSIEEFEELDEDWANKRYFDRTKPVFWHYNFESEERLTYDRNDFLLEAKEKVMLIHNALVLSQVTENWPNPTFSMIYLKEKGGFLYRESGLFHRTYILNGRKTPPLTNEQLVFIKNLAETWHERGLSFKDDIFLLIHAISSVSSGNLPLDSSILPLVVALEGFLIDTRVEGIAKEITKRINLLFQKSGFNTKLDVERIVKQSYSWRSKIIHGKRPDNSRFINPVTELLSLLGELTIAALQRMNAVDIPTKELTSFQKKLYED